MRYQSHLVKSSSCTFCNTFSNCFLRPTNLCVNQTMSRQHDRWSSTNGTIGLAGCLLLLQNALQSSRISQMGGTGHATWTYHQIVLFLGRVFNGHVGHDLWKINKYYACFCLVRVVRKRQASFFHNLFGSKLLSSPYLDASTHFAH
jgi:hypothetical protein